MAGGVSLISLLSLLIHPGCADRQAPKQNSLQAAVIHIPYLHGPRLHRQKQAGAQGGAGGGQMEGGDQKKQQPARANILNIVINEQFDD